MYNKSDVIYTAITGWAVSTLVYLVGGIDHLLIAYAIFIVLDYATGVISAWYNKELSSRLGWWGLVRKTLTLVFVIVANQVDIISGNSTHFYRNAMMMFIIGTEGISIFENLGKMGLPAPKFIMTALIKLRGDNGSKRRKTDRGG